MFIQMGVHYFKAVTKVQTRLWFAPVGPLLVAGGVFSALQKGPPAISVAIFLAGSSIMRIQASMIERCPWKSLRNGALLIIGFMVLFMYVLRDFVWSPIGLVIAGALFWLHREHEERLAARASAEPNAVSHADFVRQAQAAHEE